MKYESRENVNRHFRDWRNSLVYKFVGNVQTVHAHMEAKIQILVQSVTTIDDQLIGAESFLIWKNKNQHKTIIVYVIGEFDQ